MQKPKPANKYELLRKALRAEGLEVDNFDNDESYLDAVFGAANMILDIRMCTQD
jgi:hypothetical protein